LDKGFKRVVASFAIRTSRTSKKNDADRAWVLEILSEVELIVDSYEQPLQRPTDNEEQKKITLANKRNILKRTR